MLKKNPEEDINLDLYLGKQGRGSAGGGRSKFTVNGQNYSTNAHIACTRTSLNLSHQHIGRPL